MESIKFGNLLINFTTEFNWIWDNKGSPNASPVGFWRPVPSADFLTDYFPLGDYAVAGHHNINKKIVMAVVCEAPHKPKTIASTAKHSCLPMSLNGFGMTKAQKPTRTVPYGAPFHPPVT